MRNADLLARMKTHEESLAGDRLDVTGVRKLGQAAQVAPDPGMPPAPPPGGPAGEMPGGPAAMGTEPIDATVPVAPGPLDGGMGAPDHDPAVADTVRALRDQVDEMQRGQEDANESLRELSREIRELRLDDAPADEREREMDRMRENMDDARTQPASVGEFGVREPGLTAGRNGRSNPMSNLREARLKRMAARGRTAQSNENGEMFPSGTGVDLENDHWDAASQAEESKTKPPPVASPTTEGEMDKIEGEDVPEWLETASRGVVAVDLEVADAAGVESFLVVSDRDSARPIAVLNRPASLHPKQWGTDEYGATLRRFIATRGLARTLHKLHASPVGIDLAAKLRARRAQSAAPAPVAPEAAMPAGSDPLDDPRIAARVDQIIRAHNAAHERTFKLAFIAGARGHIDLPLKGALRTMLAGVVNGDPSSLIEDALMASHVETYDALMRCANEFMRETPDALTAREHTLMGMTPRRATPLRSEAGDLRRRAEEGSYVPLTAGRGTDLSAEVGWAPDRGVPNLVPELDATHRMRRFAGLHPAPRGSFGG